MTTTAGRITARAQIRAMVTDELEVRQEIHLTELARHIAGALRADPAFLERFMNETLVAAVYEEVRQAVGRTRNLVRNGDYAATTEVMEERRQRFTSRFATWFEHSGRRSVRLLEMTREDLQAAAEERRKRGRTELKIALLWDRLADGLEGGQTVGERFTTDEIEERYSAIEEDSDG